MNVRGALPHEGQPCQLAAQLRRVLGPVETVSGVETVSVYLHGLADQIEALETRNATLEGFLRALKMHLLDTDVTRNVGEAVEARP